MPLQPGFETSKATDSALKKKGGSANTILAPERIAIMKEVIEKIPQPSARRHSVSLGLSKASVRRILHKDLHFFPYKIQTTHALQVLMAWADGTARLR
jgi:hypothetical protein